MLNLRFFYLFLFIFSAELTGKQIYTVGVESISFMPYSEVSDGQYKGILRDILDTFSKKENLIFKYKPMPVARLYADFYSLQIDLKCQQIPTGRTILRKSVN